MIPAEDLFSRGRLPVDHTTAYEHGAWWARCQQRSLEVQRCQSCTLWIHPPLPACPSCWSERLEFEVVSTEVTLYTWVTEEDGRTLAIVELDEQLGLRMPMPTSDSLEIESLEIGQRYRVGWLGDEDLITPVLLETVSPEATP